jgi:hypothetical protein
LTAVRAWYDPTVKDPVRVELGINPTINLTANEALDLVVQLTAAVLLYKRDHPEIR